MSRRCITLSLQTGIPVLIINTFNLAGKNQAINVLERRLQFVF